MGKATPPQQILHQPPGRTPSKKYPQHMPQRPDPLKNAAKTFIADHRAAALATVDGAGKPHLANVYCLINDDLTLYFSTRVKGRKFDNLLAKPDVAMIFSNETTMESVQLSGDAVVLNNPQQSRVILHELMKLRYADPQWPAPSEKLLQRSDDKQLAIIKVTPFEMTYANFATDRTGHYKTSFHQII